MFDRSRRVREDAKARWVVDITYLFGDGAVAVNENCAPHSSCPANFSLLIASASGVDGQVISGFSINSVRARSKTSAGAIAVIQRWSIGQSRNIHGAQSGGFCTISPSGEKGRVVKGLVGPKMTSVGRPSA